MLKITSRVLGIMALLAPLMTMAAKPAAYDIHWEYPGIQRTTGDETFTSHGSLTLPRGIDKPTLLILDSDGNGVNRDGNQPDTDNDSMHQFAKALTSVYGIAVFRFDKRGAGKSGVMEVSSPELRFDEYVGDILAWIDYFERDARFGAMVVGGHGEGALSALLAAQKRSVTAYISLAGAAKPANEQLREQLNRTLRGNDLAGALRILEELEQGRKVPQIKTRYYRYFRPQIQDHLLSWFRYDPAALIAKIALPTLIIHGTEDLSLDTSHARILGAAQPAAKVVIIDNMNHLMKHTAGNFSNQAGAYKVPEVPLHPDFTPTVAEFIKASVKTMP